MVIGSPFLYIDWIVCNVTFLRGFGGGVPRGEWEEYRFWVIAKALLWFGGVIGDDEVHCADASGDDMHRSAFDRVGSGAMDLEAAVRVFVRARDMVNWGGVATKAVLWNYPVGRGNRGEEVNWPFCVATGGLLLKVVV
jgi:hypothetical protein